MSLKNRPESREAFLYLGSIAMLLSRLYPRCSLLITLSDRSHNSLDRIEVHVVAYQIAPYQNGMVTIMIPQIRFSDRPLKPQSFLRQIVYTSLPLGEGIVLDPFMGSGSTVAAAEAVGYAALGVEQYREYFFMSLQSTPALSSLDIEGTQLLLQLA
jgi:hypothetical protein